MTMNNSLAEVHPELVSEWSEENLPLTPYDITFGSNEKVWWNKSFNKPLLLISRSFFLSLGQCFLMKKNPKS